jgi:hypothetical protein
MNLDSLFPVGTTNNPTLAGYTLVGSEVIVYTAMAGTIVDVTKPGNTYSATANGTLALSNAAPTAGTRTRVKITADTSTRTLVIPQTWSTNRNGYITSIAVPANGSLSMLLEYTGARWESSGDPVGTTGTGDFVLSTGPAITLGENVPLVMPATLSAPNKYAGITETGVAGETLAFGEANYLRSSDARWWKTANSSQSTAGSVRLGLCVVGASAGGAITNLLLGKVKSGSYNLPVGGPVYLASSAGSITPSLPLTNGATIRVIGFGGGTVNELYFNPSTDYLVYQT